MQKSLNDITNEDLKEIENLAALFFTPREIATMLELNIPQFIDECTFLESDVPGARAFHKGRLQSEIDLRKSIIKLSKSGSSPAQTMALDLLTKSKNKMRDR